MLINLEEVISAKHPSLKPYVDELGDDLMVIVEGFVLPMDKSVGVMHPYVDEMFVYIANSGSMPSDISIYLTDRQIATLNEKLIDAYLQIGRDRLRRGY